MLRISIDAAIAVSRRRLLPRLSEVRNAHGCTAEFWRPIRIQALNCLVIQTCRITEGGSEAIARNQNTYAKRKREMEKKQKAEDKRMRRSQRKAAADESDAGQSQAEVSMDADELEKDAD